MKDSNTTAPQAVVLLSGGLDSVAALFWAKRHYHDVRAIAFRYGQPAADAEIVSAGRAATAAGVDLTTLVLADTLATQVALLKEAPAYDPTHLGVDRANVPARNIVFLSIAGAHAATWFRAGMIDLVIGCVSEDAAGFPDCRQAVLDGMSSVLRQGSTRHITVVAPWLKLSKAEVIRQMSTDPVAMSAVLSSFSCYRREGPCGECGACVKRSTAIESLGLVDASAWPRMFGGDPHREVAR